MVNECFICGRAMHGNTNRTELEIDDDLTVYPYCHKKCEEREIINPKKPNIKFLDGSNMNDRLKRLRENTQSSGRGK